LQQALPRCYSAEFDECLEDEYRYDSDCRRYEPVHQAFEMDFDETDEAVENLDYCTYSRAQYRTVADERDSYKAEAARLKQQAVASAVEAVVPGQESLPKADVIRYGAIAVGGTLLVGAIFGWLIGRS
jgi:hypothetical protein